MEKLINNTTESNIPALKTELKAMYIALPSEYKILFRRMYRQLYDYLTSTSYNNEYNVLTYTYLLYPLRKKFNINLQQLSILSWLWWLSGAGKNAVNMLNIKTQQWQYKAIKYYTAKGYLKRSTFDPALPYSIRVNSPSFLYFTPEGIAYYKEILKTWKKLIYQFHGTDWRAKNQKELKITIRK